ncbi:GntR family transcriptional regulator [Streptomyces sp. NBC_00841]|uniref:GntR family transcriptional regulator n=1 Tax=unclassified Streptomyces TaxID=2593676 RepID=UPI002259CC5D|nr:MULTISPECIES: GntR family transcriptional regulator [unclassified Streptomyces]MCX4536664.1 GntR family transcriptional regulator [Streptomyces sp. NBC_01669]WRZ98115.1 GntR family transcriptional regulator [Streptomyces sp. NBC_00841]
MPPHDTSAAGAPREGSGRDLPPARQALSDSVYENIKAMVMDHEIAPGARVGIEALARALSVSPTPIREALARLESDGLVVKRALSGYRATELLTRQGLEELFEMRLLLEPKAAALAAVNASEAQLDGIERIVEEMQSHPGPAGRYAAYRDFASLDQRFHDAIAQASQRPLLSDAVERLHSHLHIFRLSSVLGADDPTLAEHERVVRAILRRNPDRAAEAMAEHLTRSLQRQLSRDEEP